MMEHKEDHEWEDFPPQMPGLTVLPWIFWASILGLFFGFVLLSTKVFAEEVVVPVHVLEEDRTIIRLMPTPCTDPTSVLVIAMNMPPQFHTRFKAIDSEWPMQDGSRKKFPGCWAEFSTEETGEAEAMIYVVFSDAKSGFLKKSAFTKLRGQKGA